MDREGKGRLIGTLTYQWPESPVGQPHCTKLNFAQQTHVILELTLCPSRPVCGP